MDEFESVNEEQVINNEVSDFENMSDEDFAAMEPSFLDQDFGDDAQEGVIAGSEQEAGDEEDGDDPATDASADDGGDLDGDDAGEDGGAVSDPAGDADSSEAEDDAEGSEEAAAGEVDYKAEYEKLLAPFKANGKELRVGSVDEAVQLMQMGANYNKKMAALKPNLKLLKVLENNQLLDESKISFAIDLLQKKPEAIKKLVKDSGLDPLDMDLENASEYQPQTYTVSDREIELDDVLSDIRDTHTFRDTINVVTNKWDGPSKQIIGENPQLLKVINDHMASGIYDQISTEVERQRMLGRLTGLSDLDAYKQVGDALNEQGAFDRLASSQEESRQQTPPPARKVVAPKPKQQDPKLSSKRRAASSTRTAAPSGQQADYNPLAMSDEEFERLVNEKLM